MALRDDGDKVKVNIILTKTQKKALESAAAKYSIGVSTLVRQIIAEWLDRK